MYRGKSNPNWGLWISFGYRTAFFKYDEHASAMRGFSFLFPCVDRRQGPKVPFPTPPLYFPTPVLFFM